MKPREKACPGCKQILPRIDDPTTGVSFYECYDCDKIF